MRLSPPPPIIQLPFVKSRTSGYIFISNPSTDSLIAMSKRVRIYTAEDVATHTTSASCWVSRGGKVYDVTAFIDDHPGGDDLILAHAGEDIGEVMQDKLEHEHSDAAYNMLDEYVVGRVGVGEAVVRDGEDLPCPYGVLLTWLILFQTGRRRMISTQTRRMKRRITRRTRFWTSVNLFSDRYGKQTSGPSFEL